MSINLLFRVLRLTSFPESLLPLLTDHMHRNSSSGEGACAMRQYAGTLATPGASVYLTFSIRLFCECGGSHVVVQACIYPFLDK